MGKRFCRLLAVMAVIPMLLAGCSGKGGGAESGNSEEGGISASELLDKVFETQGEFPEHLREDSAGTDGKPKDGWQETFGYLLDIPADDVEEFSVIYSSETTADEITIVKLKDSSGGEALEESMKKRLKKRTSTFENYGPEEVSKLEKAVIEVKGKYGALIISSQPEAAKKAFEEALGQ